MFIIKEHFILTGNYEIPKFGVAYGMLRSLADNNLTFPTGFF